RSSLLDLHDTIQDVVDFDRDHPFEFFAGRNYRNRKLVFGNSFDWEENADTYAETTLEQVYPLPKSCKLYYHFDFGDDWYFEIRKGRKKPREPEPGIRYPRIVESIGPAPQQYGSWEDE
ncbi:MAG: IS1096 element passenger TnpR family protein, partial [Desulfobacteria bacterium]